MHSSSSDGRGDGYLSATEALIAGLVSGTMESLISSPFEIVKLRAQVASASHIKVSPPISEKSVARPLVSRILPRYSLDGLAMNNTVGLLSTLSPRNANISDALKEYPWMMTGSGRPPPVSNVRMPSDIVSLEGWPALWRGCRAGLVRDSVFGGMFFSTWQFLHQALLDWKAVGMNPIPRLLIVHLCFLD